MNNLPVTEMPPNVAHLIRTSDGANIQPDVAELNTLHFDFDIVPFVPLFNGWLKRSPQSPMTPHSGYPLKTI